MVKPTSQVPEEASTKPGTETGRLEAAQAAIVPAPA